MDAEAARLRCRVQELEARLSRHEQHGAGLEALLLHRENENTSLKEKLAAFRAQAAFDSETSPPADDEAGKNTCEHRTPCSPVKIQRTDPSREGLSLPAQNDEIAHRDHAEIIKLNESVLPDDHKAFDMEPYNISVLINDKPAAARGSIDEDWPNVSTDRSYRSEIEEEKEVYTDPGNARGRTSASGSQQVTSGAAAQQKPSAWRMDIHALAVSYKIKRLKQQLLVLEKLSVAAAGGKEAIMGTTTSKEAGGSSSSGGGGRQQPRSYQLMMSFVSKHVKRYQSLEDKIDDLCTRMEESKRSGGRERQGSNGREQSAALGRSLEETFQLQRYMVATGQKLLEMQSRIATTLTRAGGGGGRIGDGGDGVDTGRFMDVVGMLLRDVQRGLEVRIARIIGDLEGTLTFHGILQTTF